MKTNNNTLRNAALVSSPRKWTHNRRQKNILSSRCITGHFHHRAQRHRKQLVPKLCRPQTRKLPWPLKSHGPITDRLTKIINFPYRCTWTDVVCFLHRIVIRYVKPTSKISEVWRVWMEYMNLCWRPSWGRTLLRQRCWPVGPLCPQPYSPHGVTISIEPSWSDRSLSSMCFSVGVETADITGPHARGGRCCSCFPFCTFVT